MKKRRYSKGNKRMDFLLLGDAAHQKEFSLAKQILEIPQIVLDSAQHSI
jgi:hypothetical protein